jgi:predicted O-methyltransferase YrrM
MPILSFAKRYSVALAGTAYALSLGLATRRHRGLVHTIAKHFGYDDHPPRTLPEVSIDELTSYATPVVLAEAEPVDGNVTLYELLCLSRLARERKPRAIFEIGTFDGRTTLNLAHNSSDDTRVYTLDLPPSVKTQFELSGDDRKYVDKPASGTRLVNARIGERVQQLYGDSAAFDFTPYRADFVFVDGSHTYEYVMSDSAKALELLGGERGTIVWHDYGEWPGVTLALNELRAHDSRFAQMKRIKGTSLALLAL